ncbi:TIM44-like domain-containing protein [Myxococcota bacterium]|nr:TIM44-like domain-containing protein [Myxococcota bacterium]
MNRVVFWSTFILISLFALQLWARAGGGGGGGGDKGGDGIGEILYLVVYILVRIPFPFNIIIGGTVLGVAYYAYRVQKQKTFVRNIDWDRQVKNVDGFEAFKGNNPEFDEKAFKEKVHTCFMEIQKAWEKKELGPVRRWISDGVYQRFNMQFRMMDLLKQKNTLESLTVKNIQIDSIESDGAFDIINVAIRAIVVDKFVSQLDPSLNSGGKEEFLEFWSFIRKRGNPEKDAYSENSCPNCSSPLPEGMGEVSKCDACGSIINSGEYDWVLSEITQADDYAARNPKLKKAQEFSQQITELIADNADFSVQLVEDKASNGYLQLTMAIALKDQAAMRRFVNDKVFEKASAAFAPDTVLFNRFYLNDVSLIGVLEEDNRNVLAFSIKSSCQRVKLVNGKVVGKDNSLFSETEIVLMSRDKKSVNQGHSLYSHSCPGCGGPLADTLDVHCPYCGGVLNSTSYEWIITDLLTTGEYQEYRRTHKKEFLVNLDPALVNKLYDVRDYAFNNVMVMIAADGVFDEEEQKFAMELAKKWGYPVSQISSFFQMAMNKTLVIRMPDDAKKQQRIYKLMVKAAMADNTMAPEEQKLLDDVRGYYKIEVS